MSRKWQCGEAVVAPSPQPLSDRIKWERGRFWWWCMLRIHLPLWRAPVLINTASMAKTTRRLIFHRSRRTRPLYIHPHHTFLSVLCPYTYISTPGCVKLLAATATAAAVPSEWRLTTLVLLIVINIL